jgi:protein gp37
MNKTKIEWCDYTWNPVTGCKHGCPYCYAERISKRFTGDFEPKFHENRLSDPQKVKKSSKIFVVSMGDLFGDWVPDEWIQKVFEACQQAQQHTYLFLTKNPYRYLQLHLQEKLPQEANFWYGTTLTGQGKLPFNCLDFNQNFISIEPLLGDVSDKFPFTNIQWVIVGAQTGPRSVRPEPKWVQSIIDKCRACSVPIFLKDNLNWPEKIQEWPERLNDA